MSLKVEQVPVVKYPFAYVYSKCNVYHEFIKLSIYKLGLFVCVGQNIICNEIGEMMPLMKYFFTHFRKKIYFKSFFNTYILNETMAIYLNITYLRYSFTQWPNVFISYIPLLLYVLLGDGPSWVLLWWYEAKP